MDNMHELSSIEYCFVLLNFHICTNKAAHPVVGDDHGGEDLQLTERLKGYQGKEDHLFGYEHGSLSVIRS